jgi:transcriptional regulator with XRE-family HTH domain
VSINQPISFLLPEDLAKELGRKTEARRLTLDLTRKTLAERSGVPESTIRKFEKTGVVSLVGLLQLADALNCLDDFSKLFPLKPPLTVDEFIAPQRKRGRK